MAIKNGWRDLAKESFWRQTIQRQYKSRTSIRQFCEAEGLVVQLVAARAVCAALGLGGSSAGMQEEFDSRPC